MSSPPPNSQAARTRGFADTLKERTASLHKQAEESGVIAAIFSGQASLEAYALLLRNLLPAYRAMEAGLTRHREKPGMAALARREVFRARAIEEDLLHLAHLARPKGPADLPVLPEAEDYARRITAASEEGAYPLLLAHAYTRYLGDLAGGRILGPRVAELFHLEPEALSFYAFPEIEAVGPFSREYRRSIDLAAELIDEARDGRDVRYLDAVIEECVIAFQMNIALSEAVQRHVLRGLSGHDMNSERRRGGCVERFIANGDDHRLGLFAVVDEQLFETGRMKP